MRPFLSSVLLLILAFSLPGCAVVAVTGAVVGTTASVVGTTVSTSTKVVGGAVSMAIPDGEDDDDQQ
ncbi:hypothetical protein [Roseibium limicola]|uniref:Lipoprotein n=1 Tax=Roseibium limicola TaxID=2816037 RepID=A0A939ERS8_9HYPH|nr:hypothetical protein [Roseibium limicola]MBO0346383.1 hypothetical protein [Roseibium limicola]